MIKKAMITVMVLAFAFCVAACGTSDQTEEQTPDQTNDQSLDQTSAGSEAQEGATEMKLFIGDEELTVDWEENEAITALSEQVQKQPLTIEMSMYDDFEQVGELGMSLPADDEQIETESGDIMLYSSDKIVLFYGSNSWAYTRLGKVTDKSPEEMSERLGQGDVTITIQAE